MTDQEAIALGARLVAAFPASRPSDGTGSLYVEYIRRYPMEVGRNAVDALIERETFIPAIAELQDELREHQRDWDAAHRPERTALDANAQSITPEQKAREREVVKKLLDGYRQRSRTWSQPEAPVYVEVEEREGRVAPAVTCSGIGKPVVYRNGHMFCPDCENHDVDPGCISWSASA